MAVSRAGLGRVVGDTADGASAALRDSAVAVSWQGRGRVVLRVLATAVPKVRNDGAMAANIHDVARLAGVSPRTVSNVVNDFVHVRPGTRTRVQAAIEELGYRPNISARRLRQGKTRILALAVPELKETLGW